MRAGRFRRAIQRLRGRQAEVRDGQTGAVTFVQRFSGNLRLTPHLHAIVPDGLFGMKRFTAERSDRQAGTFTPNAASLVHSRASRSGDGSIDFVMLVDARTTPPKARPRRVRRVVREPIVLAASFLDSV